MRYLTSILLLLTITAQGQFIKESRWMDVNFPNGYLKGERGKWQTTDSTAQINNFPFVKLSKKWLLIPGSLINSEGKRFLPSNPNYKSEHSLSFHKVNNLDSVNFSFNSFVASKNYVSNKDFSVFLNWVKDSMKLCEIEAYIDTGTYSQRLDWKTRLGETKLTSLDTLKYEYWWIDFSTPELNSKKEVDSSNGWKYGNGISDRSDFIKHEIVDLMVSVDWSFIDNKSIRSLFENHYSTHDFFENYPILGLNENQISSYLDWCTEQVNCRRNFKGKVIQNDIRLGTEYEIMMLPQEFSNTGKLEVLVTKEFIKEFGEGEWKLGDLISVNYPSLPFRLFQTNGGTKKSRQVY